MEEKSLDKKSSITCFAETNFRNIRRKFGIKKDDRRRHMYLIGKTGMGKTTAMEHMIIDDIEAGRGVALVDPHGDFAEKILDFIPASRINDVVYFNPGDIEFPVAFNVLECKNVEAKHLVASGLVGIFKKMWADTWGPRLEYVLRNAILALMDYPGSTLLGIMRILVDKPFRKKVILKIKDPVVKSFWVDEYSKYPDRFQAEAIAPIQNKVGQFLSTALIRNVVGQVTSSIDLREIMDKEKILIMNLSKGRVGEDASSLLGAMMITKIQLTAMERIDTLENERKDFYLYVDEFQNFATESFANILSEARKYRLNLIMAHQYIEQLDERVQAAVFGNVGTIISFRVGALDAEALAKEFAPYIVEEDLVSLTKYECYLKLMIDGVASTPFSAKVLPPHTAPPISNRDKIIRVSRERYAKPRSVVEDKIARWTGMTDEDEPENSEAGKFEPQRRVIKERPESADARQNVSKKEVVEKKEEKGAMLEIPCDNCGKETIINFKPDGIRPVYCKDCLKLIREERQKLLKESDEDDELKSKPSITLREAMQNEPITFGKKKEKNIEENRKGNKEEQELHPDRVIKL